MPNLYQSLKSNDGLRGLFCVFFVATLLTFYELYMFFVVVVPQVKDQVDNGIEQVSNSLNDIIYTSLSDSLDTTKTRQQLNELVKIPEIPPVNGLQVSGLPTSGIPKSGIPKSISDGISSGEILDYLTNPAKDMTDSSLQTIKERELRLTNKINNYTKLTGLGMIVSLVLFLYGIKYVLNNRGQSIGSCTWKVAFVTIILIFSFQYSFYLYGQNYKYLGTLGDDELVYYLMKQLDKNTDSICDSDV